MAIRWKTGGRTQSTPNKATAAKAAEIAASGLTPLDFAISTMRRYAAKAEALEQIADDETATPSDRAEAAKTAREYTQFAMDAAKTAAPYVHPKPPQSLHRSRGSKLHRCCLYSLSCNLRRVI